MYTKVEVLFFAAFGHGLKCYSCVSLESMADCKDKMKEIDCPANLDRCSSMSLEFDTGSSKMKSYAKSCSTKLGCESDNELFKNCKKVGGATCKLDCCDTDTCNGGTVATVSVILMVACALRAFF